MSATVATTPMLPLRPGETSQAEVVAGGTGGAGVWFRETVRAWPFWIDDLTKEFGDDLYELMLNDPVVAAAIDTLKAGILEDGLRVSPAVVGDADGAALAVEIAASAARMFEELDPPLVDALDDLLGGLALGNRVAELVYALRDDGGVQRLMLAALKVKPRTHIAFAVDAYTNVVGLLARTPSALGELRTGTAVDVRTATNLYPRNKFAVYTHRPVNHDPRGTSLLRPAYTAWNLKRQIIPEYLKYLVQFAMPSLVGTTGQNAQPVAVTDSSGVATGTVISAQEALKEALIAFRNGAALAVPFGTTVQIVFSQGDGAAFLAAFAELNSAITLSILGQTLATGEGQHNARAAAEVHQDVLATRIRRGKAALLRLLHRDVLRQWVAYNWGIAALPLLPVLSLGETEEEDRTARMTAVAALERAGYLAPSQRPQVDLLLGLPQRTPEEVARDEARAAAPPPAPVVLPAPGPTTPPPAEPDEPDATEESEA